MNTKVISAFPGTGKTYYVANANPSLKIVDLDSNSYTLGHADNGKVGNPDFPGNYVKAIKKQLGHTNVFFISIHQEVREVLSKEGIEFSLVYPEDSLKTEYIERFRQRHSPQAFINLFEKNWDAILNQLRSQKGCSHTVLRSGQYINDLMSSSIPLGLTKINKSKMNGWG